MNRRGIFTSEFWVTATVVLVALVAGFKAVMDSGTVNPDSTIGYAIIVSGRVVMAAAIFFSAALTAIGYGKNRTEAKKNGKQQE